MMSWSVRFKAASSLAAKAIVLCLRFSDRLKILLSIVKLHVDAAGGKSSKSGGAVGGQLGQLEGPYGLGELP